MGLEVVVAAASGPPEDEEGWFVRLMEMRMSPEGPRAFTPAVEELFYSQNKSIRREGHP